MPQREKAFLVPFLLAICACCAVQTHANAPMKLLAVGGRESTLGGRCFDNTLGDSSALRDVRMQIVKFNQKKSMYRDGDIIAVYKLDRPGHGSLAGCADACLLNWRLTDDTTQALDTDCSLNENSHCPMTSGILVADRKCEAFMFNRITSVCTLLSAERSLKLTQSSDHWSGKLMCEDISSVDDWAQGVVSRRSPPPPPPPPPPSPPPPPPSPPPPPPSPPPPPPFSDVITQLTIGNLPFTSQEFKLTDGVTSGLPQAFVSACSNDRLDDPNFYKIVRRVMNLPIGQTVSVDTCDMPSPTWDTYLFIVSCTSGTSTCSCKRNDDSCGLQSQIDVTVTQNTDYYVIISSYYSGESGLVDLTFQ